MAIGTVNIGDRQKGRLLASSVINCLPQRQAISAAIQGLYEPSFRSALVKTVNPYGDGGASRKIVQVLSSFPPEGILKQSFHDIPG